MGSHKVMLLDTASLYFRAFFGVPDSFHAPDGTPVNAVRGLMDFVARLIADHSPGVVVACWDDDWRPQWRVDLVPGYKGHRVADPANGVEEVPSDLAAQVPIIEAVLAALGIPRVGKPGYEADDIIGTYTTVALGEGRSVDIVTGDRDLFQLVDSAAGSRVIYTARSVVRPEIVDDEWVRAKYGVPAGSYADFATLRGDASDGLPGVPGVGEKTAAALIQQHGDVAGVVAAAADPGSAIKPRVRASLLEQSDYLDRALQVVRVVRDLELQALPDRQPAEDSDALARLAEGTGQGSVMRRASAALRPLRA